MMKCPICGDEHPQLITRFNFNTDRLLFDSLREEAPDWQPQLGACSRCLDGAQVDCLIEAQSQWRSILHPGSVDGYRILPTPVRLQANTGLTGKDITICLIDSGFYPHPDLVKPENRILKMVDIPNPDRPESDFHLPQGNAWHGTMTSVVCAGNGYLSRGMYASLAPEAKLVLLKVSDEAGRISGQNIARALEWVLENHVQYGIRIVNMSVTDDEPESWRENRVSQLVQQIVEAGITVVAAAGNDPDAELLPPASCPHAITVGGLNDRNTLLPMVHALYHSTYGLTTDHLQKPDLIAPAIWLAAPVLPMTDESQKALIVFDLWNTPDEFLAAKLANLHRLAEIAPDLVDKPATEIRTALANLVAAHKWISPYYQHADGTSFAAPIVCGVIAQMLEINPLLTPGQIREILLSSARPLPQVEIERQGYGVLHVAGAVALASKQEPEPAGGFAPLIDYRKQEVVFHFRGNDHNHVAVSGEFNNWSEQSIALQPKKSNRELWTGKIPMPDAGVYQYKFLIDNHLWKPDPANPFREPDGFNGFNSQLIIE